MKKALILVLLTSVLLIAACSEPAEEIGSTEAPTTEITTQAACGDGYCDNSEMCNINTLETGCAADCGPCPSSIYVEPFECGDSGCEKTGSNEFTIKVPSYIKANVANLGETIANTMSQEFKCYENNNRVIQTFGDKNYKGVLFVDYFDNREKSDEVRLTARTTEESKIVYKLDLKRWEQSNLEDFDVSCNFEFRTKSPIVNNKQNWIIKFRH